MNAKAAAAGKAPPDWAFPHGSGRAAGSDGTIAPETLWEKLERGALEKGTLDKVDVALIRTLCRRADRPEDVALQAVLACLLSANRSGGLRIPLDPEALGRCLAAFLESVRIPPAVIPDGRVPAMTREGEPAAATLAASAASGASPGNADPSALDADLEDPANLATMLAARFDRHRKAGSYAPILGEPPEFKPLLHTRGGLYFQKHQAAEATVGVRLAALVAAPDPETPPETLGNILDTVLRRLPLRSGSGADARAMEFDPGQLRALSLALRKRFAIISGGPGTGKTSLAANLLRAWTRSWAVRMGPVPPRIRLGAPTGRAAQRLAESLRRSLESVAYGASAPDGGDGTAAERAADRFVASLTGETLHALLRYNPGTGEYFHQAHRPLPADLVIVDEVSMVDVFALARLLDALEEGACLILLGDMDQLPSVEAGSVLADLAPSGPGGNALRENLAMLDRSHRSEAGILEVTRRVNAMDGAAALAAMPAPMPFPASGDAKAAWPVAFRENGRLILPGGGCRMLLPGKGSASADYRRDWEGWLDAWVDFHYLSRSFDPARFPGRTLAAPRRASYEELVRELGAFTLPEDALFHAGLAWKGCAGGPATEPEAGFARWLAALDELFAYLDQARILTLTRKGWYGAERVNRRIRDRLARRWDPSAAADGEAGFNGCPILIVENDHAKGLFNGDVGALLRLGGRSMAFFRRADGYRAFPAPFLPRHDPAFAMTVHKSQGSEYDQVLLVLPEAGNRLLYKETLYTGLTRARHFAGVYGPAESFLEASGRKVARESGLPGYFGDSAASAASPAM